MNKSPTGLSIPPYRAPLGRPLQILIIGAHPDDAEVKAGGATALWSRAGHNVKIVSLTDGRCGHHSESPENLVIRRKLEAEKSAKILGATTEILNNPDAELIPGINERKQVVRLIREWKADLVLTHRANDYHADHRATSLLVQDASFLVTVPRFLPEFPALRRLPVFLFLSDNFQRPNPFQPDFVLDIDPVSEQKLSALLAIRSQFLEWLPWISGVPEKVPADPEGERNFVRDVFLSRDESTAERYRQQLISLHGPEHGRKIRRAEAFELCEYGSRPSPDELQKLFP